MQRKSERHTGAQRVAGPGEITGLTPAELEAESAEALPERAAMSTLSVALDPTAGSVDGLSDGVAHATTATADSPGDAADGTAASSEATTTAADAGAAPAGTANAIEHASAQGAEHIPSELGQTAEHPGAGHHSDHPGYDPSASEDHPGKPPPHSAVMAGSAPGHMAMADSGQPAAADSGQPAAEATTTAASVEEPAGTSVAGGSDASTAELPSTGDVAGSVADSTATTTGAAAGAAAGQLADAAGAVPATEQALTSAGGLVGDTLGSVTGALPAVNDTVGTVGDLLGDTVGSVAGTLPAVNDTLGTVGDTATDLLGALDGTSLLDLDADLTLDLDLAAPISAAAAANANAAIPIDAAVGANVLSPDATSLASAPQDALLQQQLAGEAVATSTQDSAIAQGEAPPDDGSSAGAVTDPASTTGDLSSLLDLDVNLDLGLDLAAPIDAAIAANANVAAPIDAAVSANILSPGSTSVAIADQNAVIVQTLEGIANATTTQTSTIDQGVVGS